MLYSHGADNATYPFTHKTVRYKSYFSKQTNKKSAPILSREKTSPKQVESFLRCKVQTALFAFEFPEYFYFPRDRKCTKARRFSSCPAMTRDTGYGLETTDWIKKIKINMSRL